jgi:hypothetical protein
VADNTGSLGLSLSSKAYVALLLVVIVVCGALAVSEFRLRHVVQSQGNRIQQLEDIQAIERLERAYGYYVDKNLWDQVIDLFADTCSAELDQRGVFLNKGGVRRMFLERMGHGQIGLQKGTLFNHIQVQGIVTIAPDGRTAKARYRAMVQVAGFRKGFNFWSDGIYENEYVKERGVWKFSKLKFWPTYYTPFHEGWDGKQLPCINGDGTGIVAGADLPSTDHAGVFPDVYYPPFHYVNPVTGRPVDVGPLNAKAVAETSVPDCRPQPASATVSKGR